VTPDDFSKLAARAGCHATVTTSGDTPLVALTHGTRAFLAFMDWRVPGQHLYSLVALQADLTLSRPVSDEAISRVNAMLPFVKVWRTDRRTVRLHMPLVLDGGVTAAWLAQSLQHWMSNWRECERQLRAPSSFNDRQLTISDQRSEDVQ
jgi:Putative bacterial sensory transduction regulator